MIVNANGLLLIKTYEGLRLTAYPDPGTNGEPWTIGYGHTSAAGLPRVVRGLTITKEEADAILERDVARFSGGVDLLITNRKLTENQYSALVSFAFNVGLGNFRKSSVLKAVNAGELDKVPWRLQLWVKAAGRKLPGLVKRRAAEAALFERGYLATPLMMAELPELTQAEQLELYDARIDNVEPDLGKSMFKSKINLAAVGSVAVGAWGAVKDAAYQVQEAGTIFGFTPKFLVAATTIVALVVLAGWVINERWKQSNDDGV